MKKMKILSKPTTEQKKNNKGTSLKNKKRRGGKRGPNQLNKENRNRKKKCEIGIKFHTPSKQMNK